MDIRNWGLDQVMQLPDHCFGAKRVIAMCGEGKISAPAYDICETGLGERAVVWGVSVWHLEGAVVVGFVMFKLGDQLPATLAEFNALEDIFPEMACVAGYRSILTCTGYSGRQFIPMRRLYHTAGRRIVMALGLVGLTDGIVDGALLVSSVPREVPDCLLSV